VSALKAAQHVQIVPLENIEKGVLEFLRVCAQHVRHAKGVNLEMGVLTVVLGYVYLVKGVMPAHTESDVNIFQLGIASIVKMESINLRLDLNNVLSVPTVPMANTDKDAV
jgi:hypothetical protein